jgi:phosphohistidine phosphatase SixA
MNVSTLRGRVACAILLSALLSPGPLGPALSRTDPSGLPYSSASTVPGDDTLLSTIIIVRHAEKDTAKNDPGLTGAGKERSQLLRAMLSKAKLTAVFATQYTRTRETVRPAAEAAGLNTVIVGVDNDIRAHARALVDSIAARGPGTFLVASHSNVIPAILAALGVAGTYEIPDDEYDGFYIVTRAGEASGRLVLLRYGEGLLGRN